MANLSIQTPQPGLQFFRFSHSQRIALVLIFIICLLFAYFLRQHRDRPLSSSPQRAEVLVIEGLDAFMAEQDAKVNFSSPKRKSGYTPSPPASYAKPYTEVKTARLFAFDPNTVSLEALLELGLSERAAQNLINYREKGGKFRNPEDLSKLYSLKPEDAQRLIPYVRIDSDGVKNDAPIAKSDEGLAEVPATRAENMVAPTTSKALSKLTAPIDVNLADSFSLTLLPGIGAKRAGAICRFREKLGGFATIEQVGETYGLPDSVFRQILPYITIGSGPSNKICLNTASETQLKNHPYIGWQMAKIIVAYRNQHGSFSSVEDLSKIYAVKKDWLEKVKPFLKAES